MRTVNRIIIVGHLGKDPDVRAASGGLAWGLLSVATNRVRRDGDNWIEEPDWHSVKVFGREAEFAARALRKGSLVCVEGSIAYEKWTSKDNVKHVFPRIHADRVTSLTPSANAAVTTQPLERPVLVDDAPETLAPVPNDALEPIAPAGDDEVYSK
jgi:single-strand DNA-binding protein